MPFTVYRMYNLTVPTDCRKDQYQCIDGSCHFGSSGICQPIPGYCPSTAARRHYCPAEDFCQVTDFTCLRPCGVTIGKFKYNNECAGYPRLCSSDPLLCPPSCTKTQVKCRKEGKCARTKNHCTSCIGGFQCKSDGKCLKGILCDRVKDCKDGSDEEKCSYHQDDVNAYIAVSIMFVIILLIIACCCVYFKRKRRRRARRRFEEPSVPPSNTTAVTLSVPSSSYWTQDGVHMGTISQPSDGDAQTPTAPDGESDGPSTTPPPPSYMDVILNRETTEQDPQSQSGLPSYDEIMKSKGAEGT